MKVPVKQFRWNLRKNYWHLDEEGNPVHDKKGHVIMDINDGSRAEERIVTDFIAQSLDEAEQTLEHPIGLVNKADPEQWGVEKTALIPVMVNAIKEIAARVASLENR